MKDREDIFYAIEDGYNDVLEVCLKKQYISIDDFILAFRERMDHELKQSLKDLVILAANEYKEENSICEDRYEDTRDR